MSREAVVLRVDAGPTFGFEAWNRCQVLAYGLQRRRRPCYFLAHLQPNGLALSLKRSGHDWLAAEHPTGSPQDLEQLLREIRRLQAVAVILDSPAVGPDYLAELAAAGVLVMQVDTQAAYRSPAHLVLNPTLNRQLHEHEVCANGQVLCGQRYVLVRPEIKRVRPQRSLEPPEPLRVAVAMGDAVAQLTREVVKTLLSIRPIARIEVLTWAQHPAVEVLQKWLEKWPDRLALATEPASWGLAMMRSHLAIATAGPCALELAYVGVPALLITDRSEQQRTAETLQEEGIAYHLGRAEDFSASRFRTIVQELLADPRQRQDMSRMGRAFLDGRGTDRFVQAIEILLHAPARRQTMSQAA